MCTKAYQLIRLGDQHVAFIVTCVGWLITAWYSHVCIQYMACGFGKSMDCAVQIMDCSTTVHGLENVQCVCTVQSIDCAVEPTSIILLPRPYTGGAHEPPFFRHQVESCTKLIAILFILANLLI